MDKRRSPRYAISLNALVHPSEGRSWLCVIQDFCAGGMLLVEQEAARGRREPPGIIQGQNVCIHFSVPGDSADLHLRLEGTIVRVMESGVGINFPEGMSEEAMTALLDYSNLHSFDDLGLDEDEVDETPSQTGGETEAAPRVVAGGADITQAITDAKTPAKTGPKAKPRRGGLKEGPGKPAATADNQAKKRPKARSLELKSSGTGLPRTGEHAFTPRGGITPADASKIVADARKVVAKILPEMGSAFFGYMDNELLILARDAKSNAAQSDYFAAMSTLEKAKKSVIQSISSEILDQIDKPRDLDMLLRARREAEAERKQKKESNKRVKLSLVNTDDFEDWLAVANIISRSERVYERYLTEIRARAGMLVDSWSHIEANPFGTSVFCHAFDGAIHEVELSKEIRQKVYSGFEAKVVPLFRKLYVNLTRLFEDSGLFPDVDEDYIVPAAAVATEQEPAVATEPEPVVATEPEPAPAQATDALPLDELDVMQDLLEDGATDAGMAGQATRAAGPRTDIRRLRTQHPPQPREKPAPRQRGSSPVSGRALAPGQRAPGQRMRPTVAGGRFGRRQEDRDALTGMYDTVRALMSLSQSAPVEDDRGAAEIFELEEVHDMLSALDNEARSASGRLPIRQRVMELSRSNSGRAKRLAPELVQGMQVVENLVDTIEQDNILTGTSKDWIRRLELTLDKVATQEAGFLDEENPHNAVEVLNQLARLGGADSGSIKQRVDNIVERIYSEYDTNPAVFDEAAEQLQPLVERQSRAFTGNVQRTVKASEGQRTLTAAQQAVVTEMDERLLGDEVPEVLLKLLMPGWRNLLVNTHLRQGPDSPDWQRQLNVLDQVFHQLNPATDPGDVAQMSGYLEPQQLLQEIEAGLDSIAFEPGQRAPLVASLRQQLLDPENAPAVATVPLAAGSIAETLGFAEVQEREQRRSELRATNEADPDWAKQLAKAKRLHVGDWVEIHDSPEETLIAIIAWASDDNENFVLVNRGVKTHELSIEEVTSLLARQELRVLEEHDIPLTDRASHQMLQNMHNRLTHQATHDELTGLINRKEFERQLEIALVSAKGSEVSHVIGYLDLDQFKVINNTCGHNAGDQLLLEIAEMLEADLVHEQVILSRLGGDEFGLLISDCDKESGLQIVRRQAESIKAFRFDWEGQQFSLTTSCGLVQIDHDIDSVSTILSAADAACYAAKDAGRDRIHVYEADDTELADRRGVMEFVAQIDKALEGDRFELNCQMISPINADSGDQAHYEILLTVLDENNKPLPPQDFIIAAETYNRMGLIDRWVIKNAFAWIAENMRHLEGLGAFSINLSGNSLTEDDFMEFVLAQFNATRLPTSMICFEITETSAIGNLDDAIDFMERMKVIGVQFSLDDFGTGLSSYSYLRNLPVDFLKIDGIFVKDIKDNANDYAVVKSINEIGHFMGKKTIAEFVEDDEILEILREIGVDYAQGYGIQRKMPLTRLLEEFT